MIYKLSKNVNDRIVTLFSMRRHGSPVNKMLCLSGIRLALDSLSIYSTTFPHVDLRTDFNYKI